MKRFCVRCREKVKTKNLVVDPMKFVNSTGEAEDLHTEPLCLRCYSIQVVEAIAKIMEKPLGEISHRPNSWTDVVIRDSDIPRPVPLPRWPSAPEESKTLDDGARIFRHSDNHWHSWPRFDGCTCVEPTEEFTLEAWTARHGKPENG